MKGRRSTLAAAQRAAAEADAARWDKLQAKADAGEVDLDAITKPPAASPDDDDDDGDDEQTNPEGSKTVQWVAAAAIAGALLWFLEGRR